MNYFSGFSNRRRILLSIWGLLFIALIVINMLSWLSYLAFQRLVSGERSTRLRNIASLAAELIRADLQPLLAVSGGRGGEAGLEELSHDQKKVLKDSLRDLLYEKLLRIAGSRQLSRVALLDIENRIIASSSKLDAIGVEPVTVPLYDAQILSAWRGDVRVSRPVAQGSLFVQSVFAPIQDENGIPMAVLWIQADNMFIYKEAGRIRGLFLKIALISIIVLILAAFVVRRLVSMSLDADEAAARVERLSTIGRLAAGVSHEIRNPLSIITSTCQYLQEELESRRILTEDDKRLFYDILEEIDRLNGIVSRFLGLAREPVDRAGPVEVGHVVRSAVRFITHSLEKRGIRIDCVVNGSPVIHAVPEQLRQILLNLLFNAADALDGKEGAVFVEVFEDGDVCRISVRDEGEGFPEDILADPFRPFVTTKKTGTGLGLSVVRNLVGIFSGRVSLSNDPAGGAVVTLEFPLIDGKNGVDENTACR